jgi:hypothetical protein
MPPETVARACRRRRVGGTGGCRSVGVAWPDGRRTLRRLTAAAGEIESEIRSRNRAGTATAIYRPGTSVEAGASVPR